jgi:hypothetical protein
VKVSVNLVHLPRLCSKLEHVKDVQADHSDHHSAAEQAVSSQFYRTSSLTSLSYFPRFFLLPSASRLPVPARSQGPVRVHGQRGCRDPLLHELVSAYCGRVSKQLHDMYAKIGWGVKRRRLTVRDAGFDRCGVWRSSIGPRKPLAAERIIAPMWIPYGPRRSYLG